MAVGTRVRLVLWYAMGIAGCGLICSVRDSGYAGPHHDEVIALLASKGLERDYGRMLATGEAPLNQVVPAHEWQRFTKDFVPVSWSEIRRDVQAGDKHPPLAFWVFNRGLSLFRNAGYRQAVWLTWLQIVLAGGILAVTVCRLSGGQCVGASVDGASVDSASVGSVSVDSRPWVPVRRAHRRTDAQTHGRTDARTHGRTDARTCFVLFLLGNSAIFTATWVRQYALFAVFYALTMLVAGELARKHLSVRQYVGASVALGLVCVGGMSTQYTFATMSAPIHLALLGALAWRREWGRTLSLCAAYVGGAVLFLLLNPGAIQHARVVSQGIERRLQVGNAFWGIPQMLIPWPSFLPAWICWVTGAAMLVGILALGGYVAWAMATRGARVAGASVDGPSVDGASVDGGSVDGGSDGRTDVQTHGRTGPRSGASVGSASVGPTFGRRPPTSESPRRSAPSTFPTSDLQPSGLRAPDSGLLPPDVQTHGRTGPRSRASVDGASVDGGSDGRTDVQTHGRTGTTGAAAAVVLAGMLGAGALQVVLVALGFYLGWATGPNHLCAFWLLTVLAWGLFLHLHPQRWLRALTVVGLVGMLGMQLLYGWHCHRIKPRTSVQQALALKPDLVVLDRLARGYILEVTDVLPPDQAVLAAASASVAERVQSGELDGYRRALYLPIEESVIRGKPLVTAAFSAAGWKVTELPVVHTGLYEAVLLTRE